MNSGPKFGLISWCVIGIGRCLAVETQSFYRLFVTRSGPFWVFAPQRGAVWPQIGMMFEYSPKYRFHLFDVNPHPFSIPILPPALSLVLGD